MASGVDPAALRAARERAGLTQHQLARLVGVAGGERVSRWEAGVSEPRPELLVRVARILEVPAIRLIDVLDGAPDLRALRFAAGLSAATTAARAHVSKPTYVRWEAGRWERLPSEQSLRGLAKALRVGKTVAVSALDRSRLIANRP
jgi:transcriptional regulator with XRE-family HTH domain